MSFTSFVILKVMCWDNEIEKLIREPECEWLTAGEPVEAQAELMAELEREWEVERVEENDLDEDYRADEIELYYVKPKKSE